jgi:hypothetical protein
MKLRRKQNMDNTTVIAVTKAVKDVEKDSARDSLNPGKHSVDVYLHLKGTLTVGEDYEQSIIQKLCPYKVLLVALNHLNKVTVDSIVQEVIALQEDEEKTEKLKKSVKKAMEQFGSITNTKCKGKTAFNGLMEDYYPVDVSSTELVNATKE